MTETVSVLYAIQFKDENGALIKAPICLTEFNTYDVRKDWIFIHASVFIFM